MVRVLVIVAALLRVASADPGYPEAITERPLVLPDGITQLEISETLPTYWQPVVSNGRMTTQITRLGDYHDTDVSLARGIGPVEAGVDAGRLLSAWLHLDTRSVPSELTFGASTNGPQPDGRTFNEQHMGIGEKLHLVPGRYALYAGAGVELVEIGELVNDVVQHGHTISVTAAITAEVQLSPRLGMYAGVSGGASTGSSNLVFLHNAIGASTTWLYAIGHWDFVGEMAVGGLPDTPLFAISLGLAHRWYTH